MANKEKRCRLSVVAICQTPLQILHLRIRSELWEGERCHLHANGKGFPGRWVAFLIDNHGMTYGPAPNDLYKIEKGVSVRLVSEVNHNDETVYL
jgi:hypothetical protein